MVVAMQIFQLLYGLDRMFFMLIGFFSAAVGPCNSVEHGFGLEHLRASIFKRDLTVTVINTLSCSALEIISYNTSLFASQYSATLLFVC